MSCRLLLTLPITLSPMLIFCRPASLRRPRNQWPPASHGPETLTPTLDVSKQTPCRAPGPQNLVHIDLPELRRPRALRSRPALAHCNQAEGTPGTTTRTRSPALDIPLTHIYRATRRSYHRTFSLRSAAARSRASSSASQVRPPRHSS